MSFYTKKTCVSISATSPSYKPLGVNNMIILKSNILYHFWNLLFMHFFFLIPWLIDGMKNIEYYFFYVKYSTLFMVVLLYPIMCVRNYDIYIFNTGIGIKNKWRLIGKRKWKFKFHDINSVEFRLPKGSKDYADIYFWINNERFNLLIKNSNIFKLVEILNQKNIRIKLHDET